MEETLERLLDFFDIEDENGVSNLDKMHIHQKILRRVETTDKNRSVEEAEKSGADSELPNGIILSNLKNSKVHWAIEISNVVCQFSVALATVILFCR